MSVHSSVNLECVLTYGRYGLQIHIQAVIQNATFLFLCLCILNCICYVLIKWMVTENAEAVMIDFTTCFKNQYLFVMFTEFVYAFHMILVVN